MLMEVRMKVYEVFGISTKVNEASYIDRANLDLKIRKYLIVNSIKFLALNSIIIIIATIITAKIPIRVKVSIRKIKLNKTSKR